MLFILSRQKCFFFIYIYIYRGMAIYARPMGTRSGLTLMAWVLPGPIKNKVGFGLKKKKRGPGWVRILTKTQTRPDPVSLNIKLQKNLPIYIHHNPNLKLISPLSLSTQPPPSLTLTLTCILADPHRQWTLECSKLQLMEMMVFLVKLGL